MKERFAKVQRATQTDFPLLKLQTPPEAHFSGLSVQHAWSMPPHATHIFVVTPETYWQLPPSPHTDGAVGRPVDDTPGQHGWSTPPHARQLFLVDEVVSRPQKASAPHVSLPSVPQQPSPTLPQLTHIRSDVPTEFLTVWQSAPSPQAEVCVVSAQQGCPGPPHAQHVRAARLPVLQTFPAAQVPVVQHDCPSLPQATRHILATHEPSSHMLSAQHF